MKSSFLFLSLLLTPSFYSSPKEAPRFEGVPFDKVYDLAFEDEDIGVFSLNDVSVLPYEDEVLGKSANISFSNNGGSAKGSQFTCENDTIYTFVFKYRHAPTEGDFLFEVSSDSHGYGVFLRFNGASLLSSTKDGSVTPYDRKNYELRHESQYQVLKCTLWSGWEGDWHFKFSGENVHASLVIDDFAVYKGVAIETERFYSAPGELMFEDGEGSSLLGGDFLAANYRNMPLKDGRITSKPTEVISGHYSIAASWENVNGWQPFLISAVTLEENVVYSVSFDYKCVAGEGKISVNASTDGQYYRLLYLTKDGGFVAEGGQYDSDIGSEANHWHNNYYGEHNCACYVINRGSYYSVKFTFINCKEGAVVKFVRVGDDGQFDDSRYVLDNIRVTKGTLDVVPNIDRTPIVPPSSTKILEERFDSSSTQFALDSHSSVAFDKTIAIAGAGSLRSVSKGNWSDFATYKSSLKPNNEYAITFKYKFNSLIDGSWAYVNIKNPENPDRASYLGFNMAGAYSAFSNNIKNATFLDKDGYMEATIHLQSVDSSALLLVLGGYGSMDLIIDDFLLAEGEEALYVGDSEINNQAIAIYEESFEGGYGIFSRCEKYFEPNATISPINSINGHYSAYCLNGTTELSWMLGSANLKFERSLIYTISFRACLSGNGLFLVSFRSHQKEMNDNSAVFNSKGELIADYSPSAREYKTVKRDGWLEVSVALLSCNADDSYLAFGLLNQEAKVDDVRIFKGLTKAPYEETPVSIEGGEPIKRLVYADEHDLPSYSCKTTNLSGLSSFEIVFSDYVAASDEIKIEMLRDQRQVPISFVMDIPSKTLLLKANEPFEEGYLYTIEIEGLIDSHRSKLEKISLSLPCGDFERLFIDKVAECLTLTRKEEVQEAISEALRLYGLIANKDNVKDSYSKLQGLIAATDKTVSPKTNVSLIVSLSFGIVAFMGGGLSLATVMKRRRKKSKEK